MAFPFDNWRHHDVLGIDFGNTTTKFAHLKKGKGQSFVVETMYYANGLPREASDWKAFRQFILKNKLAGSKVACSVEDPSMKVKRIELPKMPDGDLKEATRWQMRDMIDGPIQDYLVRYQVLEEFQGAETKKMALMVYAIKRTVVDSLMQHLKQSGLAPLLIEPSPVSLLSAFHDYQLNKTTDYLAVVDLGEKHGYFSISKGGKIQFLKELSGIFGDDLLVQLQNKLEIAPAQALHIKQVLLGEKSIEEMDESFVGLMEKARNDLHYFYTKVAMEIQRSLDTFFLIQKQDKIDHLYLCGGLSRLEGLVESLPNTLGTPTSLLRPPPKFQFKTQATHLYNVALGLALYS